MPSQSTCQHEHDWTDQTVIEARAIIKRLLELAEVVPERPQLEAWLDAHNPPPATYISALKESASAL